jgi:hypothetical protein
MNKLDRMIEDALGMEDRAAFAQYDEQGLFGQVGGLFSGKLGWVNAVQLVAQLALTAGFFYAAIEFFAAATDTGLIRWGALGLVLLIAISVIKLMQWQQMQANRIIREVKRVELQIARSKPD